MYIFPKIIRKVFGAPATKNVQKEDHTKIDSFSVVVNSKMGRCSYIGEHTSVIGANIGRYCSISNYCAIGGGGHPIDWVSTSPVFNSSTSILHFRYADSKYEPFCETNIGHDVWIGTHCLIKAGVTIGNGAVIGMGSVVTKDIGPYEIWAGNPARLIKKRFDEETIAKLEKSNWWDWPEEQIREKAPLFCEIDRFKEIIG